MPIKIRFTNEHALTSFIIRGFTWSEWSHCEFLFTDGYLGADFDGVKVRPFNYCRPAHYAIGVMDCPYDTSQKIEEAARSQIGKPYDFLNILGLAFHNDWQEKNAWTCSKLVFWSFLQGLVQLLDADKANRITPGLIYLSPFVKIIEEK